MTHRASPGSWYWIPIRGAMKTNGRPGQEPVGRHLGQYQQGRRLGGEQHLFQGAVLVVCREQPLQGQHGGEQGRHPDHAGAEDAQGLALGAHPQGEQADDDDEEEQGGQDIGASTHGERQIATEDAQKDAQHALGPQIQPVDLAGRQGHLLVGGQDH